MAKSSSSNKKGPGALGNAYLFIYNVACALGWLYVLVLNIQNLKNGTQENMWNDSELVLKVVQTAAVLEIIHSAIGLVKSPVGTVFMQVFSRVWTLWAVMDVSPSSQTSIFFILASTSWALVEVPRYLFYALNILNMVPYPLFWLRYSLFAILYPTGITGELGCMYYSLVDIKGNYDLFHLPTNKSILFVLIFIVILTYIPGSPKMYGHMLKTRRKQMSDLNKKD